MVHTLFYTCIHTYTHKYIKKFCLCQKPITVLIIYYTLKSKHYSVSGMLFTLQLVVDAGSGSKSGSLNRLVCVIVGVI